MRRLALALALLGCRARETETPAPGPVASSVASVVASAPPDVVIPPIDLGMGFPPELVARLYREWSTVPKGKLDLHPIPDPERDASIKRRFGQMCKLERTCGPLWGIDCAAAIDGPYSYVRVLPDRIEEIVACGQGCQGEICKKCPPRGEGWTCPTY